MVYFFLVYLSFILLVALLYLSVNIGKWFGTMRQKAHPQSNLEIDGVSESAVFALLALLIAFSFSGAYERFEHRKMHLLEEANVYSTAYSYTEMLAPKYSKKIQKDIKEYLTLHLIAYNQVPYLSKVNQTLAKATVLEQTIWRETLEACQANPDKNLIILIMPAIDDMFRITQTGINLSEVHPPKIVYVLLIGLSMIGAFLIGYNSEANHRKRAIHTLCYVLLMAFTIYVIINIENPRAGFIRLDYFDHILADLRDEMK